MMLKRFLNKRLQTTKSSCSILWVLTLTACSSVSESFDSEATKGVGVKSISEVNAMLDQGKIAGVKGEDRKSTRLNSSH